MAQQNKLLFRTKLKRFATKFNPANWMWVKRLPLEAKAFISLMVVGYLFAIGGATLLTIAILEFLSIGMSAKIAAIGAAGLVTVIYAVYSVFQSLRI